MIKPRPLPASCAFSCGRHFFGWAPACLSVGTAQEDDTWARRAPAASLSPAPHRGCRMNKSWAGRKERGGLVKERAAARAAR